MITTSDFQAMQARCSAGRHQYSPVTSDAVTDEGALHEAILAECRRRLWPAVHSRMDMATSTALGTPDFCIAADGGLTFWVECKTKRGKLTPEQMGWRMLLEKRGHKYGVARSFTDFLNMVETWLNQ